MAYMVELPCRIGGKAWKIRNYRGHLQAQMGIIDGIYLWKDGTIRVNIKHVGSGAWGINIFETKEEADKAIENMNADKCACCGAVIPEGRQVCLNCEKGASYNGLNTIYRRT